ncbi:hypothetical protein F4776DRAFT_483973 [Hypoxylon sp. NC0597]|nr:hypothetical protein F4776DRAFT_483973 [Hypoxylon sp. NC0597]
MPSTSKRLGRLDSSKGHHTTSALSPLARSEAPMKESDAKPLQTPDTKPKPAIKDLTKRRSYYTPAAKSSPRSQSKPAIKDLTKRQSNRAPAVKLSPRSRSKSVASPAVNGQSPAATSQPPGLTGGKASNSSQSDGQLKPSKVLSGGTPIRVTKSAVTTNNHERIAQGGRTDPYHIPSDSEDASLGHRPTSIPGGRESSALKRVKASNAVPKTHRSVPPSTPVRAAVEPSAPIIPTQDAHIPGPSRRSQPRAAVQIPSDVEIISIDSSSNDTSGHRIASNGHSKAKRRSDIGNPALTQTPSHSMVIPAGDHSSNSGIASSAVSSRLRSATAHDLSSPHHTTLPMIPAEFSSASAVGASSRVGEESDKISTPVRPSVRAIGKRSSHSVNSHLNIVDEKTRDADRVVPDRSSIKCSSETPTSHPKREPRQTKSKTSRGKNTSGVVPQFTSSSGANISGGKKATKVRFKEDLEDEFIPEPSFKRSKYSDGEYRPSSTNEEQSSEDSDNDELLSDDSQARALLHSAESLDSSQLSPGRILRSGSYPKPTTSNSPINKPRPKLQEQVTKSSVKSKFGRGSKRSRDVVSGVLSLNESRDEEKGKQAGLNVARQASLDLVPNGLHDREEPVASQQTKPERIPKWNPRSWMQTYQTTFMPTNRDGVGWVADGPFKGWIVDGPGAGGYIAGCHAPDYDTLIEAEKTAIPKPPPNYISSDDDLSSNAEASCEDEVSTEPSTADIHRTPMMIESSRKTRSPIEAKDRVMERAERMKRTKHSKVSGSFPANFASPATPRHTQSPPSAVSETTSTLITQQLIDDCAPPSNQELAELMSSSPAIRRVLGSSPAQKVDDRAESVDDHMSSSSSESSSGIPAHIPTKTQSPPLTLPQTRSAPFRPLNDYSPSTAKPSKRDHSAKRVGADVKSKPPISSMAAPIKTNIVVELPFLTPEKRAEYKVVSPVEETDSVFAATPRSFKEINKATEGMDMGFNDSDAEETLQSPATPSLSKSLGKLEPSARKPRERGSHDLQPAPSEVTRSVTAQKRYAKSGEKQKPATGEGRTVQTRKRKASTSDVSVTDTTPASKKQKTNNDDQIRRKKRKNHRKRTRPAMIPMGPSKAM